MKIYDLNFNGIAGKVNSRLGGFKEVKPEESFHWAFMRQIVTNYFHAFYLNPKGSKFGQDNEGDIFDPAASGYFDLALRAQRVATNRYSNLNGDHCVSGACVYGHLEIETYSRSYDFSPADNDTLFGVKLKFLHGLKSSGVAFRERVFGVLHQQFFYFGRLKQHLIDFVSMWAMSDKSARDGGSSGFIDFIHGDEEPLPMESFLYFSDFLRTHFFTSLQKYHMLFCSFRVFRFFSPRVKYSTDGKVGQERQ